MSLLIWTTLLTTCAMFGSCLHLSSCSFNSMCLCSSDQHDLDSRSISDVSCISVPFFKLPSTCCMPEPPSTNPQTVPPCVLFRHTWARLQLRFVLLRPYRYIYMHIERQYVSLCAPGESVQHDDHAPANKRDETYLERSRGRFSGGTVSVPDDNHVCMCSFWRRGRPLRFRLFYIRKILYIYIEFRLNIRRTRAPV